MGESEQSLSGVTLEVLDGLQEGCQVIGRDWRYLYVNDAVVRHAKQSRDALLGHTMMECYPGIEHTEMFAKLRGCMETRQPGRMENQFEFPDGSKGWFELRFLPVPPGVCVLSLDISERKRAEERYARAREQLRQSQKMEALGRLAGGVAHDFNNVLTVVLSCTDMLLADMPADNPHRADVEEIGVAGKRAAELTRQLLTLSRRQRLEPRVLDVGEVARGMSKMLRRLLGADVELAFSLSDDPGRIEADPSCIEQVLLNLVVNARDAMPTGGCITVETQTVELDDDYAAEHHGVQPGRYVMLAVSDTGSGMDTATRERMFEPFFTTKDPGEGTGLGLSTVFGIIKQSGGHVWVYSELGRGTSVKAYFPCVDAPATQLPERAEIASPSGSETVLLVEDDNQVRAIAATVLRKAGYLVLEAADAQQAFRLLDEQRRTVDLLLTDVVLPRMSGKELAEQLASKHPGLKVLFTSGYTDDAVVRHGILPSEVAFLQKPLTPERLRRRVREVLGKV